MNTNCNVIKFLPTVFSILLLSSGCAVFRSKDVVETAAPLDMNLLLTPVAVTEKYITPSQLPGNYVRVAVIDFVRSDRKNPMIASVKIGSLQKSDLFFRAETETWQCGSAAEVMRKLDPHIDLVPVVFILAENGVLAGSKNEPSAEFVSFLKDLGEVFGKSDVEFAYLILPHINILR